MAEPEIFGMTLYQAAWAFVLYSFAGWVVEVVFHAVTMGRVVNRGFLNGPVCPVYGFGVLSVFAFFSCLGRAGEAAELAPAWQLFLGGCVLATLVELFSGWLLDVLFHTRWWDYSGKPFNFRGYVCLEFSLIWGLAVTFVMREVQPFVRGAAGPAIPERIGVPLLFVLYASYLADAALTVLSVLRFNRHLEELERLRASMRIVSDGMSRVIGGGTVRTMEELERGRARAEEAGEELRTAALDARRSVLSGLDGTRESLQERRARIERRQREILLSLRRRRHFGEGRLLRAFPDMTHRRFAESLRWIREQLGRDGHGLQ